jgi:hypothetical protein
LSQAGATDGNRSERIVRGGRCRSVPARESTRAAAPQPPPTSPTATHAERAEVHGGDQSHQQSALYVLRTDNGTRVRDGYNRLSTRGHARPRETQLKATICRSNVYGDARPCTPVPPQNLHGKEGVDGSSPSEGSAKVQHVAAFAFSPTCRVGRVRWVWSRLWSFRVQNGVAPKHAWPTSEADSALLIAQGRRFDPCTPSRTSARVPGQHAESRSRRGLRGGGRLRDDFGAMGCGGTVGPRGCPEPVERF